MVRRLFECRGGHGTCFAYGQTGSGKTVTMEGLATAAAGNAAGLYSYVADEVFACVAKADKAHYGRALVVRAGFFEVRLRRNPLSRLSERCRELSVV